VIASQTIETQGAQVPIPFELTYDPAKIDPRFTHAVSARITTDGKLTWISDTRYNVLTRDTPMTGVDIVVVPVGATTTAASRPRTVRYTCANDVTVTVKYNANSAEVTFDGKTEVLPQVESGSGIRYSNANWEWNSKGKEGFLTDRKSNTIVAADCRTR
jgi:membrane-bound inhibitor of C-type lysozyme